MLTIANNFTGASTGGFVFQCSDGFEATKKLIFVVTASPLIITVNKPEVIQVTYYSLLGPTDLLTTLISVRRFLEK